MALTLDPALSAGLRGGLALLLGVAAWHKLRDLAAFRAALGEYQLVPARALGFSACALIAAELATAGALLLSTRAGGAAAALLALYTVAIGINVARGRREIDCACFGPAARQPLSLALVVRNICLVALALTCALPAGPRELVLLDGLTIAAGIALGALLYGALNGLLVNAPRLRALRGA